MKPFSIVQENILLCLGVFGGVVPNGIFLYYSVIAPIPLQSVLLNPIAMVFVAEAFILMFFFAWLIHHLRLNAPGWFTFIIMSLVGSMAFSIPIFLYLTSRKTRRALEHVARTP